MGIDARLVVYATDKTAAEKACSAAFARIAVLDGIMSDYRKDSELMRLCDKAGGPAVPVSVDLYTVLKRAQDVSRRTGGAFDVTVGPLVQVWRAARRAAKLPTEADILAAKKLVGWRKMRFNDRDRTVRLSTKGMRLDLGGIAKGYAADEAQKVLKSFGIERALVEMGGDIVVSGPPPGTQGWNVQMPNAEADMRFVNCGVSSSGDTEQSTVIGGVRYSHVVDPRTGKALTERVQSTVVAPDGLTSDPVSTAVTILGPKERARFLRSLPGTKAYVRVLPLVGSSPR